MLNIGLGSLLWTLTLNLNEPLFVCQETLCLQSVAMLAASMLSCMSMVGSGSTYNVLNNCCLSQQTGDQHRHPQGVWLYTISAYFTGVADLVGSKSLACPAQGLPEAESVALRKRFMARADALFPVGRRRRRSSVSGAGVPRRAMLSDLNGKQRTS